MKYIDPEILIKLSNLRLRARYIVEGFISGIHTSPLRGHSLEFTQHREYSTGDELRHIDWKVYGRTDKFFVKQYQEETNLRAYILLDISNSMNFGSKNTNKLNYAIHLAAALSYLLLNQEDSVGIVTFNNKIDKFVPPSSQMNHFSNIIETLEAISPGEDTGISLILDEFEKYLKRRGLIIFISDLFDQPQQVLKSLKLLRFKHHDVVVFHIISPEENDFPYQGTFLFESLEHPGHKVKTETENIEKEYRKLFNDFLLEYKTGFRNSGIDYYFLPTSTPLEIGLGSFLGLRT